MTSLEKFVSFAQALPADQLESVEASLSALMESLSERYGFAPEELAEIDRRVANGNPETICAAAVSETDDMASVSDGEFKELLRGAVPHLRAYGRSLSGNPDLADDLTMETLVEAWRSRSCFEAGTSIKAWTFIILRKALLSRMRRDKSLGLDRDAVMRALADHH